MRSDKYSNRTQYKVIQDTSDSNSRLLLFGRGDQSGHRLENMEFPGSLSFYIINKFEEIAGFLVIKGTRCLLFSQKQLKKSSSIDNI